MEMKSNKVNQQPTPFLLKILKNPNEIKLIMLGIGLKSQKNLRTGSKYYRRRVRHSPCLQTIEVQSPALYIVLEPHTELGVSSEQEGKKIKELVLSDS